MSNDNLHALSHAQLEAAARLFAVLSEPSRLLVLQALRDGPCSVNEIVSRTDLKQANVSRHLALLFQARLVDRKREGPNVVYRIADPMVFPLCSLVCDKMERDAKTAAEIYALPPARRPITRARRS